MRNANALTRQLLVKPDKSNLIVQFPVDFRGKALCAEAEAIGFSQFASRA